MPDCGPHDRVKEELAMTDLKWSTAQALAPTRLLTSTLGVAMLTHAVDAVAADKVADAPDDSRRRAHALESVRVSANTYTSSSPKFTASLLDTPRAVTVIPREIIQQTAATSLQDVLRTVPGITFGAGEGGNPNGDRPFIRGFDSESSILVDGIRSSAGQQREVFDIDQIEIIKGPSSAYGGRGSVGGGINMVSKAPLDAEFLHANLGIGNAAYTRGTVDWNHRIGRDSAFRLAVMGNKNHTADRNGPEYQRWGIAPSLTLGLHAADSVTFSYYHLQSDDQPDSGIPYNNPFAASSPNASLNGNGKPIRVPHNTYYGLNDRDFQRQKTDLGSIIYKHSFDSGWVLRNSTVFSRFANDYVWTQPDDSQGNFLVNGGVWRRANTRSSSTTNLTNQSDLTGQFDTGGIHHSMAAGYELSNENTSRSSYRISPSYTGALANGACAIGQGAAADYWCAPVISPNPNDPWQGELAKGLNPVSLSTRTRSLWLFDTMEFGPMWALNLGARYDDFRTRSVSHTSASGAVSQARNHASFMNYQTGLVFKPVETGSIYANWGTSSNPPGVDAGNGADGLALTNDDLKPESSRNLEVGTKWDLLDRRLTLTGDVFRTEKSNARVNTAGRGSDQINAGKYRVDGVELGFNGRLTDHWNVFGGYSYLKSKLVEPGPGVANAGNKGKQMTNTPRNSFTLWTTYAVTPALTIGGGAYVMSKVWGDIANTKWVPGYTRLDLMASYAVNRNLSVQVNIQNLTNKYYFDKAYAAHYATVAAGRTGIVNFNYQF